MAPSEKLPVSQDDRLLNAQDGESSEQVVLAAWDVLEEERPVRGH